MYGIIDNIDEDFDDVTETLLPDVNGNTLTTEEDELARMIVTYHGGH